MQFYDTLQAAGVYTLQVTASNDVSNSTKSHEILVIPVISRVHVRAEPSVFGGNATIYVEVRCNGLLNWWYEGMITLCLIEMPDKFVRFIEHLLN